MNALEFIKSKIQYSIDIFKSDVYLKGKLGNLDNQISILFNSKLVVIGDLHGNINKALEIMILADLIEIDPVKLKIFYEWFDCGQEYEDIKQVINITNNLETITWKNPDRKLIFLGDILSDRTGNDFIALNLFNNLITDGSNIEILIGNHDHACNFLDRNNANEIKEQASSFINACKLYDNSNEEFKVKINLLNKNFFTNSKLIIYDKSTSTNFAHSGLQKSNFKTALKLLQKLSLLSQSFVLNDLSLNYFCNLINKFYLEYRIEKKYQNEKYIIENKLLQNYSSDINRQLEGWFWAGERDFVDQSDFYKSIGVSTFVHGHDCYSKDSQLNPSHINFDSKDLKVVNLDTALGMSKLHKSDSLPIFVK